MCYSGDEHSRAKAKGTSGTLGLLQVKFFSFFDNQDKLI